MFPALVAVSRGVPWRVAAQEAGIGVTTLTKRVREEAVVVLRDRQPRANALRLAEREEIRVGIERGDTDVVIARCLGRHRGTIGREIAANGGRGRYRAFHAQERADQAARRPKSRWCEQRPWLWAEVRAMLTGEQCSPEQISRRLRRDHPDDPQWWVSHEAIYQALYVQGKGELRKELAVWLRSGRTSRQPQGRAVRSGSTIRAMVNISQRPAETRDHDR